MKLNTSNTKQISPVLLQSFLSRINIPFLAKEALDKEFDLILEIKIEECLIRDIVEQLASGTLDPSVYKNQVAQLNSFLLASFLGEKTEIQTENNYTSILVEVQYVILLFSYGSVTLAGMMLVGPSISLLFLFIVVMGAHLEQIMLAQGFPEWFACAFVLIEILVLVLVIFVPIYLYGEKVSDRWMSLGRKLLLG